ncbi:glycosyltransferase family 39 protein [Candidatus Microgenomates bacterium]|nr:glycosyltransferase family 39 protein [Candidatus Microgenomates bacterium]
MKISKKQLYLIIIITIACFLRFFNLMRDYPYFFDPDERNMAGAIMQFRLPKKVTEIPNCLISEFSSRSSPVTGDNQQSETCHLNPHFFAYGQFPLYLAYFSNQVTKPISNIYSSQIISDSEAFATNFPAAIFWLRFWSAAASVASVYLVYLITRKLTGVKFGLLAAFASSFSPGNIQAAHFGTTESFLSFFFLSSVYFSIKLFENPFKRSLRKYLILNTKYLILLSLAIGLAFGSKFTGLFFLVPPGLAIMMQLFILLKKKRKNWLIGLLGCWIIGLLLLAGSILFAAVSSPYNLVEPESFKSAVFGYENDVATGRYEAFYTRQFVNTVPIAFQAQKIFPYTLGWPVFILGSIGILLSSLKLLINFILSILQKFKVPASTAKRGEQNSNIKSSSKLKILLFGFWIYFIPNAFLFAKWTRFMTPIFAFFYIFTGYFLYRAYQLRSNVGRFFNPPAGGLIFAFCFLSFLPGVAFMSIYASEDSRLTASRWIYANIPSNSYVLSETANVVDIPLGLRNDDPDRPLSDKWNNVPVISFDFYHMDENPAIFDQLFTHLEKAGYIFIPSRRLFANHPKIPAKYPRLAKYYQLLFSGRLGFEKVSEFSSFPSLGPYRFNDEGAEETFTVFDHPVIRIYKKTNPFTIEQYKMLFETGKL